MATQTHTSKHARVQQLLHACLPLEARLLLHGDAGLYEDPSFAGDVPLSAAGVVAAAPLSGIPALNSNPTAHAKLYLDFNGDPNSVNTPAYDRDGDPTTFTQAELDAISEIWARVAEKYSPFNINVTTVDPGNENRRETLRALIGGNGAWAGSNLGGTGTVGEFYNSISNNTVWIFSKNLNNGDPKYTSEVIAHETGHGFGLDHQSLYSGTTRINEYNPGDAQRGPIMGRSVNSARGLWWYGPSRASSTSIQDDLAILAGLNNAFGYRPDDHGDSAAFATPLVASNLSISAAGVITKMTDADYFSLTTGAGSISFAANVAQYGPTLDLTLELRDENGNLLASADTAAFGESLTANVSAGKYHIVIKSRGNYGDVGQYTLSGTVVAGGPVLPVARAGGPYVVPENGTLTLNASASIGNGLSYAWDLDGDGLFGETGAAATRGDETGVAPTFSAIGVDGPATYSIALRVTDNQGLTSSVLAAVQVANIPPTLTISGNASVAEGTRYTLKLAKSDPGADGLSSWLVNWGDGVIQLLSGGAGSATHTYADDGTYTITASASDDDGTFASNAKTLTVTNVAPTLVLTGENSVQQGAVYTLSWSATDPGGDTIASWQIDWGDGVVQPLAGNIASVTHTYASAGAYTIRVSATDEDGVHTADPKPLTVLQLDGAAPVANPGGPYSVVENGTVTLNASASIGTGLSYAWDLDGDGLFGETGAAALRGDETGIAPTFSAAGLDGPSTFGIALRVTDTQGLTSTAEATVNITNVAPTLTLSGNATVNEGSLYTLRLAWSDPGPDTLVSWRIEWGDGNEQIVPGDATSVTHTYADNGTFTIRATATDEDGTYSSNNKTLTVNNIAPTIALSGAASVNEGSSYTLTLGAITDPGTDTVSSWIVNWGDGQTQTFTSGGNKTHVYADGAATATITVSLVDEDGTQANAASRSVTINNVAPTLSISGNASANEGSLYTLSLSASDPGADTLISWLIDWGDGTEQSFAGNVTSATHTYADNGAYTIRVSATDEDGTYAATAKTLTVQDIAPTLSVSGAGSVQRDVDHTIALAWSDPGADIIASWIIDWGDGVIQVLDGTAAAATHTYASPGNYVILASASNEEGTYSADALAVEVLPAIPAASADLSDLTTEGETTYRFIVRYSSSLDTTTLDDQDLLVLGPNGFSQYARFLSFEQDPQGDDYLATYELPAPSNTWGHDDNGTYTLQLQANQITSVDGGVAPESELGTFAIDILPPYVPPVPTATLTAPVLRYGGETTYTFTVTYQDEQGLIRSTIDNNDILVTNTLGFRQLAKLVSVAAGEGTALLATYRITAPGGYWDPTDSSVYSFSMRGTQVRNLAGNYVPAGVLGALTVRLADDQAGTSVSTAAEITLPNGNRKNFLGYVTRTQRYDVYTFEVDAASRLTALLDGLVDQAEVRLLNANGKDITPTAQYGSHPTYIATNLQPGRYYVYIGLLGRKGTAYWLQMKRTIVQPAPVARTRTPFAATTQVASAARVTSATTTVLGTQRVGAVFNSQQPVLLS